MVILIGHKKRQGKDTFATYLQQQLPNSTIIRFADTMKEIIGEALGIELHILEDLKNTNEYYRSILQRFGSGKMKELFGKDIWKQLALKKGEGFDHIIIPDFRFPEEYIEGALSVNVVRDTVHDDIHISETALDDFEYDMKIFNLFDLHHLKNEAKNLALGVPRV